MVKAIYEAMQFKQNKNNNCVAAGPNMVLVYSVVD